MSRTKQNSKRKRRSKAVPVLGAAGLSLLLASEASLASTLPPLDTMMRNAAVSHEITLHDEEVCDSRTARFYLLNGGGTLVALRSQIAGIVRMGGINRSESVIYRLLLGCRRATVGAEAAGQPLFARFPERRASACADAPRTSEFRPRGWRDPPNVLEPAGASAA
jgi:hypothetical protein